MRRVCGLALALAALWATPAAAQDSPVLLAFLPAESDEGLLERFEHDGYLVGVTSPTVGGFSPVQMYLDIGQGARVSTRTYDAPVPELRLREDGTIAGWREALARAEDAPGDVQPGLLGELAGRVAYAGVEGLTHDEAAAAADRSGRVDTVALGPAEDLPTRVEQLLLEHDLVVTRLPAEDGLRALDRIGTDGLVIVVRAPVPGPLLQLPTGLSLEPDGDGQLISSRTTRRDGMVAAPDYAPTVLDWLGKEAPDAMDGRLIEPAEGSWEDAQSLVDRLAHIKGRRGPALRLALGVWLLVLAGLAFTGRAWQGLRLGLLGAMWLPGVALVTGALDPSRTVESIALPAGSLALALATDRLVPWPFAPAAPAVVVLTAHAADLIVGSPLIVRSLAGPNPGFGARFYGIGNELEALLSMMVLIGAGALLTGRRGRVVPVGFAVGCLVAALFIGAGRLGADVGGVITLGAGAAGAVLASLPGGPSRRAIAVALATPVMAVGALALVDLASGGDAHLTRSVLDADSPGELVDVAERRLDISWDNLKSGTTPISVALFALVLAYGVMRRKRVLAPLEGERAFAAGMWGALAATVVGALGNDSGPTIFLIGAAALVLAAAYLQGKPLPGRLP